MKNKKFDIKDEIIAELASIITFFSITIIICICVEGIYSNELYISDELLIKKLEKEYSYIKIFNKQTDASDTIKLILNKYITKLDSIESVHYKQSVRKKYR